MLNIVQYHKYKKNLHTCHLLCYRRKKKPKDFDGEETSMTNVHSVNGGPAVMTTDDEIHKDRIEEIHDDYDM